MTRRQSLAAWMRANLRPTDGPDAGRPLRLEPWQRGLLDAIDRERKPIVAVRAGAQLGKTVLALGVGLRAAVDGAGCICATATLDSARDLKRRLTRTLDLSPALGAHFGSRPARGPGSLQWRDQMTAAGGWLATAAAGSPSQLASRTAKVAIADEIARWPARVRSGEGHPLSILRARLADWGDAGRLLAISTPTVGTDPICRLWADGDRRRLEYTCPTCQERTALRWESVTGRERGETPGVACERCGAVHDESARRRMLRSGRWCAQTDARDEDVISFALSRLDSARATLGQVVREYRRSVAGTEAGDPLARMVFRNVVLGQPAASGAVDVDALFDARLRDFKPDVEQVTCGVDVQADRLVHVVLGFDPGSAHVWALDHGSTLGDPTEDDVWLALSSSLSRSFGGLPVSCVSVDAGFHTAHVRRQCARRRWWIPVVSRAGEGKPIARQMGAQGVTTAGKDDTCAWWTGRLAAGRVYFPRDITRGELAEMAAAEALQVDRGRLRWKPVPGTANHFWDAAGLAIHARHFRPLTRRRGPVRLVAV